MNQQRLGVKVLVAVVILTLWMATRTILTGRPSGSIGLLDGAFAMFIIGVFAWKKAPSSHEDSDGR